MICSNIQGEAKTLHNTCINNSNPLRILYFDLLNLFVIPKVTEMPPRSRLSIRHPIEIIAALNITIYFFRRAATEKYSVYLYTRQLDFGRVSPLNISS